MIYNDNIFYIYIKRDFIFMKKIKNIGKDFIDCQKLKFYIRLVIIFRRNIKIVFLLFFDIYSFKV